MDQNPGNHSVRRIVLASGQAIDVVRYSPAPSVRQRLHVCPECDASLVQPLQWREADDHFWELSLACPNCRWHDDGIFTQEQVDDFGEQLDEGLAAMLNDLRRLTQANMAEEIERFAAALQSDLILPEDF